MTLSHRRNRTLAEKQFDIKNYFVIELQKGITAWRTPHEIAKALGMARAGHFTNILNWMVECGTLQREEIQKPGRWPGYAYALSDKTTDFYRRPRQITLNRRGKKTVETVEFWAVGNG